MQVGGLKIQDTPLDTIGAALDFDPTHLQIIKITAGETLDFVARNRFNNHSGQINLDAAKLGNPASGTFTFATIRFRALVPTSNTSITFVKVWPAKMRVSKSGPSKVCNSVVTKDRGASRRIMS